MTKEFIYLILVLLISGTVSSAAGQGSNDLIAKWSFDELSLQVDTIHHLKKGRPAPEIFRIYSAIDNVSGRKDQIYGSWFKLAEGISGKAIQLDGNSSFIMRRGNVAPVVTGSFTVSAWISLAAYPTNWCPVVDQSTGSDKGYSLGIDAHGLPGFKIKAGGQWITVYADEKISLRKWYHITGVCNDKKGISLFVNGVKSKTFEVKDAFESAGKADLIIGRHSIKTKPEGTVRQKGTAEVYTFFDGLIDEIQVYNKGLHQKELGEYLSSFDLNKEPNLKLRVLPTGGEMPESFGAFYTNLKYYEAWDAPWRVGDFPDVVVRFDKFNGRFIFWRGTSYIPNWVTENGIWYNNEFNETWSDHGCHEPMSDKRCEYSQVRIIENTDARVVVHWRYALIDNWHNKAWVDSLTGWGDWTDEVYTIYPDGVAVRAMTLNSSQPQGPHEWHESIVVMGPGQRPEEVMVPEALTLANMGGETHTFSWKHGVPTEVDNLGYVHVPEKANIHMINTKSRWKPFVIVSPESNPAWDIYKGEIRRDVSMFPWWNHWPAALKPSDGRFAMDTDMASHSSLSHCHWDAYSSTEKAMTKLMLNGLTSLSPKELILLAKSWSYPAKLIVIQNDNVRNDGYDSAERAYQLEIVNPEASLYFNLTLKGSSETPVVNPCLVFKNWGEEEPKIVIGGETLQKGGNLRYGFRKSLDGTDLILWMQLESVKDVNLIIKG